MTSKFFSNKNSFDAIQDPIKNNWGPYWHLKTQTMIGHNHMFHRWVYGMMGLHSTMHNGDCKKGFQSVS
jgi:hypothetical protein